MKLEPLSSDPSRKLIAITQAFAARIGRLRFRPPVTHTYHPLIYAWKAHEEYLCRFGNSPKRVVFLGMNPGPFGMVQTGIPFGEVSAVRDWMGIHARVDRPDVEHPQRPVLGFDCPRSEVSGRRLWKLFAKRFGSPDNFFAEHFVANYCPLAFCEASGRNLTPDKLPKAGRDRLFEICDAHLHRVLDILQPEWLIGIGSFAAERGKVVSERTKICVGRILHPSPASPKANRHDWTETATGELIQLGVWK